MGEADMAGKKKSTSPSKRSSKATTKRSNATPNDPPRGDPWKRRSFWVKALSEVREKPGVWHRVDRLYTKSTANQIASDLRSAHRRDAVRVKGVLDGETWDARAELSPEGPEDQFAIWVMLITPAH